MRKAAIIFNKTWQLEPALAAMCSTEFSSSSLSRHFDFEVTKTQNYFCAFNAGIILGYFITVINDLLIAKPQFSF